MNKFDLSFFGKYVPEGQEIKAVVHTHPVDILGALLVKISLLVLFPILFYYNSARIQEYIPFMFLEIYLILVYIKIVYDIFDWYNDVWIITNSSIIWLERSFLKSNSDSVNFDNIEGVGVESNGILDKIFRKGDLVIHKIGEDSFMLKNAVSPYRAVDLVEQLVADNSGGTDEQKFDIIMDALSGVVGDYLHDAKIKEKVKVVDTDAIVKVKEEKGTIDLR